MTGPERFQNLITPSMLVGVSHPDLVPVPVLDPVLDPDLVPVPVLDPDLDPDPVPTTRTYQSNKSFRPYLLHQNAVRGGLRF